LKLTNIIEVYRPYITFLPKVIIGWNVRFQLDVSENKVVFFPQPSSRTSWNLQVKNGCSIPKLSLQ
jgi:hypothetical protein